MIATATTHRSGARFSQLLKILLRSSKEVLKIWPQFSLSLSFDDEMNVSYRALVITIHRDDGRGG